MSSNYLWHVDRTDPGDYDEYDGVVVCGPDLEWVTYYVTRRGKDGRPVYRGFDPQARNLEINNVGVAHAGTEPGEILASFHAG